MFIRFVGSGYRHSGRKIATIMLVTILGILLFTSSIMAPLRGVTIDRCVNDMVRALHKHMISSSYSISGYDSDGAMAVNIGSHSNLYEYVNISKGIQADRVENISDPGYQRLFADGKMGDIKDDLVSKETTSQEEQPPEQSEDSSTEPSTQTIVTDKGIEGYVVPAVAENGVTYTIEQLSDFDFLMSQLYTVPARALVYESDLVAKDMLAKDMTMKNDNSKPQILVYHTHSQEGFVDSTAGDDTTSIVAVGTYLAKILSEEYGYNVIHCTEHFDMAGGKLDRSKAYTYAQGTIEQILEDNPSIEVILDIHRDGLPEGADKLVTNINGKDVAKIMLFNGVSRSSAAGDIDYLYNRYKADNLAFSFQLKLEALKCYPEFTRRNYIDAYQYNLHHRPKSVLVEVGAQNNTLQEELNAMEVFAEVLHRVLTPDS